MNNETLTCPKCEAPMAEGFILEQTHTKSFPNLWVEGPPEPSFWTVTKVFAKPKKLVATYRCVGCGYLESYATEDWAGKVNPG
ncbi:MAG: hypothetical protein U1G07_14055 [Verrucomicrobiota bacterium]